MFRKYSILIIYLIFLLGFTIYFFLDTLVLSHGYQTIENVSTTGKVSKGDVITTETSYQDSNISITLEDYYEYDTKIYVADIYVNNPSCLKTAFAYDTFGKNVVQTTSKIALQNNALIAINGDYYGVREKGYVIRNGVIYRSVATRNQMDLVIYSNGEMDIINETDITAEELIEKGVKDVLSFGPGLVDNFDIQVSEKEEVGKAMASNPRTAIAYIDKNHYLFVVSDGRTNESKGLSLYQLAEFLKKLGVEKAYNLDGGGSSTMVFMNNLINKPTTNGKSIREREVSDIVYIGY